MDDAMPVDFPSQLILIHQLHYMSQDLIPNRGTGKLVGRK
jgi:hypothetical protein